MVRSFFGLLGVGFVMYLVMVVCDIAREYGQESETKEHKDNQG